MNNIEFMKSVDDSHQRSIHVLLDKQHEYTFDQSNRLENFHAAAGALQVTPAEALVAFAAKHFVSIALMSKRPRMYNLSIWREKVNDLRNYTFLLDAMLTEMRETEMLEKE